MLAPRILLPALSLTGLLATTSCVTAGVTPGATHGAPGDSMRFNDDLSIMDVETNPDWLGELYSEQENLTWHDLKTPQGRAVGRVLAGSPPVFRTEALYVPVEEGVAAIQCERSAPTTQPAQVAVLLANQILGQGQRQEIKYLAVNEEYRYPLLVVHGLVSGGPASSSHVVITYMKVVVVMNPDGPIVCQHHIFGYRDTIERVAGSLADDSDWVDRVSPPPKVEARVQIESLAVRTTQLPQKAGGGVRVKSSVVRSETRYKLRSQDTEEVFLLGPKGVQLQSCTVALDHKDTTAQAPGPWPEQCNSKRSRDSAAAAFEALK